MKKQNGFTLIELLIVICIIILVVLMIFGGEAPNISDAAGLIDEGWNTAPELQ